MSLTLIFSRHWVDWPPLTLSSRWLSLLTAHHGHLQRAQRRKIPRCLCANIAILQLLEDVRETLTEPWSRGKYRKHKEFALKWIPAAATALKGQQMRMEKCMDILRSSELGSWVWFLCLPHVEISSSWAHFGRSGKETRGPSCSSCTCAWRIWWSLFSKSYRSLS